MSRLARTMAALDRPVDVASVAVFRILFATIMLASTVRFVARGWVGEILTEPSFHFTYWGFSWVRPWPEPWMTVHFALMAAALVLLLIGYRTRVAAALFFVTFTYAELIEKSAYLNHYYLVSLVALLLCVVPCNGAFSLDARAGRSSPTLPAYALWLLRVQVGVVYAFAGLAKLNADWLLAGEPLATWLSARTDTPFVGAWLDQRWLALAMSWGGAAFDLLVVPALLWRRTRTPAFLVACGFHACVGVLFPIGVFPFVMVTALTLFFAPSWPRRWLGVRSPTKPASPDARRAWLKALAFVYALLQIGLPLRHLAYPGDVNWTEQGFRFAWRVMLIEKTGRVEFVVDSDGRRSLVRPAQELCSLQYKMMSTQPDMIHEYALHLAARARARGAERVAVYARAWAGINGHASQQLIDPGVDLAAQPRGLAPKSFIVPRARTAPELAYLSGR